MIPGWPSWGVDQSELYAYLSVAYGSVVSDLESTLDITISISRDQLIELLTLFLPNLNLDGLLREGPFDVSLSFIGSLKETATMDNPDISGVFNYSLILPEDLINIDLPIPIDIPTKLEGTVSIAASFEWVLFSLFTSVHVSISITQNGEELLALDPIDFDLLPGGTFILWLDKE